MLARGDADGAGGLLPQLAERGEFAVDLIEHGSHGPQQAPPGIQPSGKGPTDNVAGAVRGGPLAPRRCCRSALPCRTPLFRRREHVVQRLVAIRFLVQPPLIVLGVLTGAGATKAATAPGRQEES